jgi:hypothetical protein
MLTLTPQVRDEYRNDYDPSRGGWGKQTQYADDVNEEPQGRPTSRPFGPVTYLVLETQLYLGKRRRGSDRDDEEGSLLDHALD